MFFLFMNKKYTCVIVILLIVASSAAFGRIVNNDFINYDDNSYLTENNHVKSGINPESVKWAFTTLDLFYWHPLTWLSHMSDWSIFGANASGHHLVSLILHIGGVLFLFLFLNKATNNIWPSAFAAALFALHPLRVESVAWAAERKDVLSMFLGMASLYVYILYARSYKLSLYISCSALFALSLMAKPMMVTLPFVLLLLDYWPLRRWPGKNIAPPQSRNRLLGNIWKEKILFFLLTIIISVVTFWGQKKFGVVASITDLSISERVMNAVTSYVSYLGKIFWPLDLAVFYPFEQALPWQQILIFLLILTTITILVIYFIKRFPFLFVGWFWYLGTLIPVIGLVQVTTQAMADRFTYLPSIGIAIMLSWGIPLLFKREDLRKKVLFPSAIALLFVLTILTWRQCGYWKNSFALFSHALRVTKNNAQAYNNLGLALFAKGKINEAINHYDTAIRLIPDVLPYYNRGNAYIKLNQYQRAIEDFNNVILLKPDCAAAYYNKGTAYYKINQYQRAIEDFNNVIILQPDYVEAYNNRGLAYGRLANFHRAIADFNKAIRLKSDFIKAYYNRGLAFAELGHYQKAIEDFSKAINLKSDYAKAYYNRADVYLKQGNKTSGCRDAQKACELGYCKLLESAKSKGYCR
ncbi:MAG: tetratricopeptide repeat protein [Syntrophaceae bacterium]|nr:tetratricopeptide repeat protein [Syntrophaceae bacterium]